MERRVQAEAGGWHTPAQHQVPPNPARGTKGRRRWLTFRRSPLFGLQRREGAHDGPHGSEDLCATWDPSPCPSPPLERNQCGSSTPNWRRKEKKQKNTTKHPAARLQLGIQRAWGWGAGSLFFPSSARTCTDSQGQPLPPSLRNRAGPLCAPGAEDAAPQPARCRTRAEAPEPAARAVREPRSARPCCRTLRSPPGARVALGGRVPIMNEQSQGRARSGAARPPARLPACLPALGENPRRAGRPAGNPGGAGRGAGPLRGACSRTAAHRPARLHLPGCARSRAAPLGAQTWVGTWLMGGVQGAAADCCVCVCPCVWCAISLTSREILITS